MFARLIPGLLVVTGLSSPMLAADLAKVTRTIAKEPPYLTKSPEYLLLVFGPDAADRVWMVRDGDTLYVDRNGNGDLTDPGEAIKIKKRDGDDPETDGRGFEVGDISVGGRTHKALAVGTVPLAKMGESVRNLPQAKALLRAKPHAHIVSVAMEVAHPKLKGPGVGGRVPVLAGPLDLNGMLVFAAKPAEAPIIYPDGPLQVTFFAELPSLQLGRETDMVLTVGSPGLGHGTLTMLQYDQVIPADANPVVEVSYPAGTEGAALVKEHYELKERC